MNNEINPTEAVTGDNDVIPSEGQVNDSQVVAQAVSQADDTLSLEEINQTLGRSYADKATALRALGETYSHVGKLGQKVSELSTKVATPQTSADVSAQIADMQKQINESNFYAANPEYNTPEAKALISKFGGNPAEVINDDVFKTAFNAIRTTTEIEKSKSVLHSNPRLGQVADKMTVAREASKAGDQIAAADAATKAVMEAFEIGQ
jgi:hypothetical protein